MEFQYSNRTLIQSLEVNQPSIDSVLRIQGYKDLAKVRRRVRQLAELSIRVYVKKATPTVSYRVADIESIKDEELVMDSTVRFSSPIFKQYLSNARQAVVFALTVGEGIDDQTIEWMEKDQLVEALFLESAAWMGVENATKQFVLAVRTWAGRNHFRITRRLGPGYSYPINGEQIQWDLSEQKSLFKVLGESEIPITLLESSAMLPKMSRSGLFGLIPKLN